MAQSLDVFAFELTDADMARIAELDAGTMQFFDHADPTWVSRLSSVRVD